MPYITIIRSWPALLLIAGLASAADSDYVVEIEKWRADFDADVRTGGWLTLIGRSPIPEGMTTIGSDPNSTVRLPAPLSKKRLGTLTRHGDEFPNLAVTIFDAPGKLYWGHIALAFEGAHECSKRAL